MFAFLYTNLIRLTFALAKVLARFNPKVRQFVEGRQQWEQKLSITLQNIRRTKPNAATIWFHAASLGEFEQGRPVIEAYRQKYPDNIIVLTFFSPSGYEIQKNYKTADVVSYLPIDSPQNVRQFLDVVQPQIACFIKYEFWYNFLMELKRKNIKTILFSAIFRPNQVFFKWYGSFFRQMIFAFDYILVQNKLSKKLLQDIDYQNIEIGGDTRIDRVLTIAQTAKTLPDIEKFKNTAPLVVVGSAWPDDMEVLIPFLNNFKKPLKIIIAPHEINNAQIEQWQEQILRTTAKYSDSNFAEADILFIDCVGMLSALYRYADFAYIGGAFGDGLHNILEPAAFGMPIFFGNKYYDKFQEAHDLLAQKAAFAIADTADFSEKFTPIYEDSTLQKQISATAKNYILSQKGATERVLEVIQGCL